MNDTEKREIAEQNVALMDKIRKDITYFIWVSLLFFSIDYATGLSYWSLWAVGIWGLVLAFEWFKTYHTIRENRQGIKQQGGENRIQQEMDRIE